MIDWPKNLILDGGFATALGDRGVQSVCEHPLYGAQAIHENPDEIYNVHLEYLEAGSDIIETSTYQGSVQGFKKYLHLNEDESKDLLRKGVQLAQKAKNDFWSKLEDKSKRYEPKIAGSLGPYGAHLLDCSEYTGDYALKLSDSQLKDWHRKQITQLVAENVDILGFDTFPSLKEALSVATLLKSEFKGVAAWISFSCRDEKCISDGTLLRDCVQSLLPFNNIVGFGINCCNPSIVTPLIKSVIDVIPKDRYLLVYPNTGEEFLPNEHVWVMGEKEKTPIHTFIKEWKLLGVNWIGGCCRVNPRDISLIRKEVIS